MLKELEIKLSKLKKIPKPKEKLEQYNTPERVAIETMFFIEEEIEQLIKNPKIKVLDACAGTGYLGLAFLLFLNNLNYQGEVDIYFIEKDKDLIPVLKENVEKIKKELDFKLNYFTFNEDCLNFNEKNFDLILMNPPFGIKQKIKDIEFIKKMMTLKKDNGFLVSFHKAETIDFLKKRFNIKKYFIVDFEIKMQFWYHSKKRKNIEVVIIVIQ
jgi:predicted RNA methylase